MVTPAAPRSQLVADSTRGNVQEEQALLENQLTAELAMRKALGAFDDERRRQQQMEDALSGKKFSFGVYEATVDDKGNMTVTSTDPDPAHDTIMHDRIAKALAANARARAHLAVTAAATTPKPTPGKKRKKDKDHAVAEDTHAPMSSRTSESQNNNHYLADNRYMRYSDMRNITITAFRHTISRYDLFSALRIVLDDSYDRRVADFIGLLAKAYLTNAVYIDYNHRVIRGDLLYKTGMIVNLDDRNSLHNFLATLSSMAYYGEIANLDQVQHNVATQFYLAMQKPAAQEHEYETPTPGQMGRQW